MNEISFAKFERKELDLFFSICHKLKEKGTKSVQLDFSELKELSSYTNKDIDAFITDLKSTYDKMLKLDFTIGKDSRNFTKFNLFNEYTVSDETKTVTIATNEKFAYILNEINPYTKFELLEFVSLKSSYSKNLFKKLKQYTRTYESDHKTLFWEVSIDEFRRLLDIPVSYRMSEIDKRIFFPASEELKPYFKNLKIQKIKQGKSISKLKFTWLKQHESNDEVIDITISQELQDSFDKVLKNRFIKEFLTEDNKHKLIASFDEKDLIRGLKYAKDNINYSFKTFSYLENSIKKGLEKPIIKTTVISTASLEEKSILLGEQLSIKTKVTREEYEECYQEYLKNNNKKNGKEIRASWEFSVKNKFEIIEKDDDENNDSNMSDTLCQDSVEESIVDDITGLENDELEKVTIVEYLKIYSEYLQENNLNDEKINRKKFDELTEKNCIIIVTEEERKIEDKEYPEEPNKRFYNLSEKTKRQILRAKDDNVLATHRKEYLDLYIQIIQQYIIKLKEEYTVFNNSLNRITKRKQILEKKDIISKLEKNLQVFAQFSAEHIRNNLFDYTILNEEFIYQGIKVNYAVNELNKVVELYDSQLIFTANKLKTFISDIYQNEYSLTGNTPVKKIIKNIKYEDIPEDKLLSKSGKKLVGGALVARLKKIAKELGKDIELEDGRIILAY